MQAFWQQCLESLKRLTQNTPKIYTTWFEVLKPTYWNEKDGILTLEAPATKITYIRGAYQKSISAVATRIASACTGQASSKGRIRYITSPV